MTDDLEEPPRFGPAHKRAGELSDQELKAELEQRRARRGGPSERGAVHELGLSPRQTAQYFANLELSTNAGPAEVAAAYARLVAKYTPAKGSSDAQQRSAADQLLRSLTEARDALLAHLARR
jgi:hypothetical protein